MKTTTAFCCFVLLYVSLGSQAQTLSRTQYNSVRMLSASEENNGAIQSFRRSIDTITVESSIPGMLFYETLGKSKPWLDYESPVSGRGEIISEEAFNRLIKQDMTFTVLGSQIPTPGFSLDLSDKLAAKVTGTVPAKNHDDKKIITIDAEFARVGEDIPLLTDGKFTGKVSGGINGHFFSSRLIGPYPHRVAGEPIVRTLREMEKKRFEGPVLDSVAVLTAYSALTQRELLDNACQSDPGLLDVVRKALGGYERITVGQLADEIRDNETRRALFVRLATRYFTFTNAKTQSDFDTLLINLRKLTAKDFWRADALLKDLKRVAATYNNRFETVLDAEIAFAKPYFVHKRLLWLSVGFRPVILTYDAFKVDSLSRQSMSTKMNFVEFEASVWVQSFSIHKNGGNLWRLGAQFVYGSNRGAYLNVNYATSRTIGSFVDDRQRTLNQLLVQKQTSGIWDDGSPKRNSLYTNFHLEYYYLPRQNFVPGYSFKVSYARRGAFGTDALQRLRIETGLVLNILSNNKTQSAFTVQPYIATSNLLEEMVTDVPLPMKDKLSAGIRLGLPIRGQLNAQ